MLLRRNTFKLKLKGQKKIFNVNTSETKLDLSYLILDTADLRIQTSTRGKECNFIIKR